MRAYSKKDVDKKALKGARIAVVGYGSQGRAHALNLKDSGYDVVIGVRKGDSWKKGEEGRPRGRQPADAVKGATLVALLTPDTTQAERVQGDPAEPRARRHAAVRARLQHPLQADQAAQGPRRRADRAEGPGRPRPPPVPAEPRRAVPDRGRPGRLRQGARPRRSPTPTASAARAPASSRPRSRKRPRPTCSASRPCCAAAPPSWC
jgi:hypothetical protein